MNKRIKKIRERNGNKNYKLILVYNVYLSITNKYIYTY